MKEANKKRLYTHLFQLNDFLEKVKLWRGSNKNQWLPGVRRKEGLNRQGSKDFGGSETSTHEIIMYIHANINLSKSVEGITPSLTCKPWTLGNNDVSL